MPKNTKPELELLVPLIARHPQGISIKELLISLAFATPKRTLQYRLSNLVKAGVLKNEGIGRSSKYYIRNPLNYPTSPLPTEEMLDSPARSTIIPFSEKAQKLKQQLAAPLGLRPHVSYKREFLDAYVPNTTSYLSQPLLDKLSNLGYGTEKGRPAGTYARKIYQRLLIDLSWNSSRLEGNTYSLLETEKLLATGEGMPGKDRMDTQMILNHKAAIEFIIDLAEEVDINRHTLLNIHGLLSYDLLQDPRACGRLRTLPVKIGQSVYHPTEIPQIIEEYFQRIIQKAAAIKNPFEQSFFLMVHLPYLQPFLDVNKRVSRLAGNIPLIRNNLSPLSFVDVPQADYIQGLLAIYEFNRIELFRDVFVWAYERSASLYLATLEALGEPDPFRIRYRELIRQAVCTVVQNKFNKLEGAHAIQQFAKQHIPAVDLGRFIEIAEIEVSSMHEGNFARFRIRPSEFFAWQQHWY